MRGSVWRFLLTCLLLVAMPLQGFAAGSMLVCGANHESWNGPAAQAVANEQQVQHLHHAGQSDHHAIAAEKASSGEMTVAQTASGVHSSHTNAHFKCNACVPCCSGALLTTALVLQLAPLASATDFPDLTSHHLSPALDGPDRPPQQIFA